MNKSEIQEKYNHLYEVMSISKNPNNMRIFGKTMSDMMRWFIENKPEIAEVFVDTLCAVKWDQWLTKQEAIETYLKLRPTPAWDFEPWIRTMNNLQLETEEIYKYNKYALWIVMNSIHSDNGKTISEIMGLGPLDPNNTDYIKAVHKLATNTLKDEDGRYNVRTYFQV